MVRSRWAALALATCTLFISGCGNWFEGGWFSRFRTTSMNRDCDCCESLAAPTVDGPSLTPPDAFIAPPPTSFPTAPPPRIVPIPHAAPIPYTP
jgi:hypothetical protein